MGVVDPGQRAGVDRVTSTRNVLELPEYVHQHIRYQLLTA